MNAADAYGLTEGVDRLKVGPRHVRPVTDELVISVQHRTTGDPRSVLVSRRAAAELHAWLGRWLADGWDGVPRECGEVLREGLWTWRCTREPHTAGDHAGKPVSWPATSWDRPERQWQEEGTRR